MQTLQKSLAFASRLFANFSNEKYSFTSKDWIYKRDFEPDEDLSRLSFNHNFRQNINLFQELHQPFPCLQAISSNLRLLRNFYDLWCLLTILWTQLPVDQIRFIFLFYHRKNSMIFTTILFRTISLFIQYLNLKIQVKMNFLKPCWIFDFFETGLFAHCMFGNISFYPYINICGLLFF